VRELYIHPHVCSTIYAYDGTRVGNAVCDHVDRARDQCWPSSSSARVETPELESAFTRLDHNFPDDSTRTRRVSILNTAVPPELPRTSQNSPRDNFHFAHNLTQTAQPKEY
jgi:hypothetical protein